jgi:ATP-binding cassette subfamily F protein 3
VVDAVRPDDKLLSEPKRRNLLARFGLTGQRALQKVSQLSGGERCRAALARLAAREVNFLVLDEPTNHLDLWARDALENALLKFDGTVLLVSHDRYFVNRVADHLAVIELQAIRVVEGNYDTYQMLAGRAGSEAAAETAQRASPAAPQDAAAGKRTSAKPGGKRRFPYRKVADLEDEIFQRETSLHQLQCKLAEPELLRDGQRVRQVKAEIEALETAIKGLYEHWEEAVELNW